MGGVGSCTGDQGLPDIFIDITNAESHDAEENSLCGEIHSQVLDNSRDILSRFAAYQDCQHLITAAISNASQENTEAAWNAVLPNVQFQAELFDFGMAVVNNFSNLTEFLVKKANGRATEVLERHAVAVKTLVDLFNAVVAFDETILRLNKLLSDLSFFRRSANRRSGALDYEELYAKSAEMSMFFAVASPLLTKCIDKVSAMSRKVQDAANLVDVFGGVADALTNGQMNHKYDSEETNMLCYRAIVCCIIVYDSIAANGAFHKKAGIATLEACQVLAGAGQQDLLKMLKFNTKHYKDPSTQKKISEIIN